MNLIRYAVVPLLLLLTGCASNQSRPEPITVIKEVPKIVQVGCVPPGLQAAPSYPDTDEALRTADPATRYQLLRAGRELRKARLGELEPVIEGCPKR